MGVGKYGGLDEVAATAVAAAAGPGRGAFREAGVDVAGHPPQLLIGDQRTHLRVRLHAIAELDRLGDLGDAVDDLREAALLDIAATRRRSTTRG